MSKEETTQEASASLSLNDLKGCLQIIDVCTKRGAFAAEELETVGTLYRKIREFVTLADHQGSENTEAKEQE